MDTKNLLNNILRKYHEMHLAVKEGYFAIPSEHVPFTCGVVPSYKIIQGRVLKRRVAEILPGFAEIILYNQKIRGVINEIVDELQLTTNYTWSIYNRNWFISLIHRYVGI